MVGSKIAGALIGAIYGGACGYYASATLACSVLWPQSNLCGLPAMFIGAPLGAVAGAAAVLLVAHRFGPRLIVLCRGDSWMRTTLLFALAAQVGISAISLLDWHGETFRLCYWLMVIPWLCAFSAITGYWVPRHAWRWGVAPLLGQWLWEIVAHGDQIGIGNLGPFAHVVVFAQYALSAIPCVIAAEVAACLSHARSAPVPVSDAASTT